MDPSAQPTSAGAAWPLVSVVTPVLNQGRFLERCLRSVAEQDYPRIEHIVMDGGSADETVAILRRHAPQLAHWESAPDGGQAAAINRGLHRSSGRILAWLNADDWYEPGALRAAVAALLAAPGAGAVAGVGEMQDEAGQRSLRQAPTQVNSAVLARWLEAFFWQPSVFFTREAWSEAGPLDESLEYALDLDFWFRLTARRPWVTTPTLLSTSLRHAQAKTRARPFHANLEAIAVIARHGGSEALRPGLRRYADWLAAEDARLRTKAESSPDTAATAKELSSSRPCSGEGAWGKLKAWLCRLPVSRSS